MTLLTQPLVSVVVPVHDVEPYLRRCVDSILDQTHANLDVILVDDGSTDASGDICDDYAADERVTVIHQDNGGLSVARNTGMARASGAYVTFVDSDDWLDPRFVETLIDLATAYNADIAACELFRTSDSGAVPSPPTSELRLLEREGALRALNGALHTTLTVACGKVYANHTLQGVRFPPGRLHEDEFTTYLALAAANRVVVTGQAMYHYWQRPDSITGVASTTRNWRDVVEAYEQRLAFLDAHASSAVATLARMELFRKLLHYRHWLPRQELTERRAVLDRMRELVTDLRARDSDRRFMIFASSYTRFPRAVGAAYEPYLARVRGRDRTT